MRIYTLYCSSCMGYLSNTYHTLTEVPEIQTVGVEKVTSIIIFIKPINKIPEFWGEHMVCKQLKTFIKVIAGIAKFDDLGIPRVESNAIIGMLIWIGIKIHKEGIGVLLS
jgi:hypothetical protein